VETDVAAQVRTLLDLALSARQLPIWELQHGSDENRQHISSLKIPNLNGTPSLLLHDLGVALDPQRLEIIAKIFKTGLDQTYAADTTCSVAVADKQFSQVSL
jgi:hypothetical protein